MKQILGIALFIAALGSSSLFTNLWYRDDNMSLRYNLWKVGPWPKPDHLVHALITDHGGPLHHMSKEEIIDLFPGAHEGVSHWRGQRYEFEKVYDRDVRGQEHLWLDDYDVIAIFENGKFHYLFLAKG